MRIIRNLGISAGEAAIFHGRSECPRSGRVTISRREDVVTLPRLCRAGGTDGKL